MLRRFLGDYSISKRAFLVLTILFVSVFGWFYMAPQMLDNILNGIETSHIQNLAIWATFYVSVIGSSVLGTFLADKVGRLKFIYCWTGLGFAVSLLPALPTTGGFNQVWFVSFLLGTSFGLGVPSCLAYFTESTIIEKRGQIGGITLLIANLSVPLLGSLFGEVDLAIISVIFATLRGLGLIVFFQKPEKQPESQPKRDVSYLSILRERTFMLYFVAWSMFPLVDSFERVIVDNYLEHSFPTLLETMGVVEPLIATISLVIAGVLCDWIGRKKIVLSGFVAIGIAYGIVGLIPDAALSWYIYFVVDGVAWGIFILIFFIVLWGDLAQSNKSEKYYTIGSIPYFLSSIIPPMLTQSFVEDIPVTAAFSLAGFFLFVAVMPLVFAPETLPEKKMELRRLRNFAEEAQKIKEKYENKK
jgi:MFS family permease